jgi:peptidyl-prolyl cis-trans isomerase SurA
MNKPRRTWAAIVLVLGVVAPGIVGADIIEQILVKVNGEIFTKTDLEARQVTALRQRGLQFDKNDVTDEQLRQALTAVTPQIMVEAVSEMLMVQRGKELGYRLTDEQFKSIVDNIRKENKLDSEERFQAALKQENMTVTDLRRQIERNVIASRVQQAEVFGKIGISEEEARKYYDTHPEEFTTTASVTLREVLVSVSNDGKALNVGLDEAAKEKADQLRARAVAGDDFEKMAAESSDAPSKANSGLIGPISVTDLSSDLRQIVEPMKSGDITQVVRTTRGYQFFKIESLTASQKMPFEQAREQISDRVFTGKRKEEYDKYLARLRTQAIIDWKNDDVKKAYEEGLVDQAKPPSQ